MAEVATSSYPTAQVHSVVVLATIVMRRIVAFLYSISSVEFVQAVYDIRC